MKKIKFVFIVLIFALFFVSCEKEDVKIHSVVTETFVDEESGLEGLSVWLETEAEINEKTVLEITDPTCNLLWSIKPELKKIDDLTYCGSSSLRIPATMSLPTGEWKYTLILKDGSTSEGTFNL